MTYDAVITVHDTSGRLLPGMTAQVTIQVANRAHVLAVPIAAVLYRPLAAATTGGGGFGGFGGGGGGGFGAGVVQSGSGAGAGQVVAGAPGSKVTIWKLIEGKPVPQQVVIGLSDGKNIEITSDGVREGDEIIVAQRRGGGSGRASPGANPSGGAGATGTNAAAGANAAGAAVTKAAPGVSATADASAATGAKRALAGKYETGGNRARGSASGQQNGTARAAGTAAGASGQQQGPAASGAGTAATRRAGGRFRGKYPGAGTVMSAQNEQESLVEVRDVTKVYGEEPYAVHALKGVSLTIHRGEFVAIMGPSGSGKSTFMHLLGCLDHPTSGSYRLSGQEVSGLSRDQLALVRGRQIGFVFQSFNLLSRTSAQENVELPMLYAGIGREAREGRAREILEQVGLAERMDHRPNELSGGQQQRVAIARALANEAPLLMADEPTGNLDSASSEEIMTLFKHLNRDNGITVIVVTHATEIAAWAGRVVTFHDGLIVSDHRTEEGVA